MTTLLEKCSAVCPCGKLVVETLRGPSTHLKCHCMVCQRFVQFDDPGQDGSEGFMFWARDVKVVAGETVEKVGINVPRIHCKSCNTYMFALIDVPLFGSFCVVRAKYLRCGTMDLPKLTFHAFSEYAKSHIPNGTKGYLLSMGKFFAIFCKMYYNAETSDKMTNRILSATNLVLLRGFLSLGCSILGFFNPRALASTYYLDAQALTLPGKIGWVALAHSMGTQSLIFFLNASNRKFQISTIPYSALCIQSTLLAASYKYLPVNVAIQWISLESIFLISTIFSLRVL